MIHSRHNFSKRVLALLQRAASMVVAKLQRATIGMVVMVMSARTVRRRSQINDGLPQARTRAEQAGQRRRWWWHHYGPQESESVPEPAELKDTARATCGGTNCFALHEAREIMGDAEGVERRPVGLQEASQRRNGLQRPPPALGPKKGPTRADQTTETALRCTKHAR